jgi:hypothetical protein
VPSLAMPGRIMSPIRVISCLGQYPEGFLKGHDFAQCDPKQPNRFAKSLSQARKLRKLQNLPGRKFRVSPPSRGVLSESLTVRQLPIRNFGTEGSL